MPIDINVRGSATGQGQEVNSDGQAKVVLETDAFTKPQNVGGVRMFSEVDSGSAIGTAELISYEADNDYRLRVSQDLILDEEVFNYTAQNTGKHSLTTATMAGAYTAGNFTTNSAGTAVLGTGTGVLLNTYATFPLTGTQTLSIDAEIAFSAQPTSNVFFEFGIGIPGAVGVAPTDATFIRVSPNGLTGVCSYNGAETVTSIFPLANGAGTWVFQNNKKYQFIIYSSTIAAEFWVNDGNGAIKLGSLSLPNGQGRMQLAPSGQFFFKHRVTGGSSTTAIQGFLGAYNVRLGGSNITSTVSTQGNRILGAYQGHPGTTLGSNSLTGVITTGSSANPTAAVPTTTTAALGSGLGGRFWETATVAANTDAIIMSYQVPAVSVNGSNKRLVLRGIYLNSYVQTTLANTAVITTEWFLAFGHTAVSLATAEAATTKAPRRIALPFTQQIAVNQAIGTTLPQSTTFCDFGDAPVFINPGEFLQLCKRNVTSAAATAGVIVHQVTPVFGWE